MCWIVFCCLRRKLHWLTSTWGYLKRSTSWLQRLLEHSSCFEILCCLPFDLVIWYFAFHVSQEFVWSVESSEDPSYPRNWDIAVFLLTRGVSTQSKAYWYSRPVYHNRQLYSIHVSYQYGVSRIFYSETAILSRCAVLNGGTACVLIYFRAVVIHPDDGLGEENWGFSDSLFAR